MDDERNLNSEYSSLDDILSEIDDLRKNRISVSEDEFAEAATPRTHRFADGDDDADEVNGTAVSQDETEINTAEGDNTEEDFGIEDLSATATGEFNLDELFTEDAQPIEEPEEKKQEVKPESNTQVIDAPLGHELYFSLGQQDISDTRSFATEEYEPEEYGLAKDDNSLSYISRGVRQIKDVRGTSEDNSVPDGKTLEHVSPSKRNEVALKLRKSLTADLLRSIFTGILTAPLMYIGFAHSLKLSLPSFLNNTAIYGAACLSLLVLVIAINIMPLVRALRDVFTAKPTSDAPLPFAALASAALIICDIVLPSAEGKFPLFAASFSLAMFFSSIFRGLRTAAVLRSFSIVGSNRQKGILVPIEDEKTNRDVMGHIICNGETVFKPERCDFVSHFIRNSYSSDISSHSSLILFFISVPLAILTSVLSFYADGSVRDIVSSACAIFLAFTPLTSQFVFALPFSRLSKKTAACSSAVIGYKAADSMNNVGAVVIDSNHLFPKGSISLDAMRTFGTLRIDDAIADAASVVCAAGGALSRIFLGVIDNDRSLLREVDSLLYEDGLGLSAWVNEKRVLVGTAELLRGHGVTVPSRDYEARYAGNGQNLVYVSVGGILTAMFVVSYHARQEIYDILFELRKQKIGLVIVNRDCNITSQMITKLFDFPSALINIMPPSNEHLLGESMEKVCPAGIVYSKGLIGIGKTVISSLRLVQSVSLANAMQIGGILLTTALTVYLATVGSISQFTLTELLACQSVWGALTFFSAIFRKS